MIIEYIIAILLMLVSRWHIHLYCLFCTMSSFLCIVAGGSNCRIILFLLEKKMLIAVSFYRWWRLHGEGLTWEQPQLHTLRLRSGGPWHEDDSANNRHMY